MPAQDGIALLKEDHRALKKLFKDFFAAGDRANATRRRIADKIIIELSLHSGIEETILYPRARAALPEADRDLLEALEEHHVVKMTCAELEKMQPTDERFAAKMRVMMENVKHHIGEEESELFPMLRRAFSRSDLIAMGEDMRAARRVVPARPHPNAPDEPPGNVAAAMVAVPVEAAVRSVEDVVLKGRKAVAGVVEASVR
jgi:hemerythrin-like domain-containing protein